LRDKNGAVDESELIKRIQSSSATAAAEAFGELDVDRTLLPEDAQFKGHEPA
jgi:hypothetical protein